MPLRVQLRQLREDAGMSVREAAARLGKSPGYLSRIEGRGEIPSAELLCEMAALYDSDPEELFNLAKSSQLETKRKQIEAQQEKVLRLYRRSRKRHE